MRFHEVWGINKHGVALASTKCQVASIMASLETSVVSSLEASVVASLDVTRIMLNVNYKKPNIRLVI